MANNNHIRFDHREIAVIFSLFIFVSLLMFTVGILVGKGLAQAKYEAMLMNAAISRNEVSQNKPDQHAAPPPHGEVGTSITTPSTDQHEPSLQDTNHHESLHHSPHSEASVGVVDHVAPVVKEERAAPAAPHAEAHAEAPAEEHAESKVEERKPLELIPERPKPLANRVSSPLEPPSEVETQGLMNNPKIRSLLDDGEVAGHGEVAAEANPKQEKGKGRKPASVGKLPPSYPKGKYTVQVGSYPSDKDATERVEQLKKFGFPFAYSSAKELGDQKDTWYRVWLGYYPDYESARQSGQYLQEREEVRNYLVRKQDFTN